MRTRKPVIGLVGGIGSGKSTVAELLAKCGALVIDSDRTNHALLNTSEVQARLVAQWGRQVIDAEGRTDRAALRQIIGQDAQARKHLESIMHPRIAREREAIMARHAEDPGVNAFVWDTPLLYEAGLADQCDVVIFVDADKEIRRERVFRRGGWSEQDWQRLEKAQLSLDFKRDKADYRIENNSDIDVLRTRVDDVFSRILSGESFQRQR